MNTLENFHLSREEEIKEDRKIIGIIHKRHNMQNNTCFRKKQKRRIQKSAFEFLGILYGYFFAFIVFVSSWSSSFFFTEFCEDG